MEVSTRYFGVYEVLDQVGAGGMGTVYRARDTRLDRIVAIKVLSRNADDVVQRLRFDREARTASSLNHPNICALYDIGQQEGVDFLVMEYLEGQTVADRLVNGPLPVDRALSTAIALADALAFAHRSHVVHRDIKPQNVVLTRTGPKLLDFGLAKRALGEVVEGVASATQTLTAEGKIVGTLQYMAPEQLEGRETDARSDIFAFGALLYEMFTGRAAFAADSAASVIGAVMHSDPPPVSGSGHASGGVVSSGLDRVVRKCLAKDPDQRWQTAVDLRDELRWLQDNPHSQSAAQPIATQGGPFGRVRRTWIGVLLSVIAVASTFSAVRYFQPISKEAALVRLTFPAPEGTAIVGSLSALALSPDGRQVAFVATTTATGKTTLWVRPLDSSTAHEVSGTEGANVPFWSPDGGSLGFRAGGKLMTIALAGGPPQTVCDVGFGLAGDGTWGRDGTILFSSNRGGRPAGHSGNPEIYRVAAAGGSPTRVTVVDPSIGETAHHYPQFLTDGRHYLYTVAAASAAVKGIYLGSFGSSERTRLIGSDSNAFYTSPGYLLFLRQGRLSAQAFDATRSQLHGDPFQLGEQVDYNPYDGRGAFAVSDNGVLIYRKPNERQLTWFDRSGRTLGTIGTPGLNSAPILAPDGSRVLFNQLDPVTRAVEIWSWDLKRGTSAPVIRDGAKSWGAILSPNGSRIAYISDLNGPYDLYERSISGEGAATVLRQSPDNKTSLAWSPDSRFLIFSELDHSRVSKLWALPMVGTRTPIPIVRSAAGEWQGQVSPDGHWLAYVSDEGGTEQVYVRPFPAGEGKWSVSTRGGTEPHWRRDGKEVFYIGADGHLMVVPVRTDPTFVADTPSPLFMTRMGNSIRYGVLGRQYDVTADGQRFLINQERAETGSQVSVVLNWPAELSAAKSGDR